MAGKSSAGKAPLRRAVSAARRKLAALKRSKSFRTIRLKLRRVRSHSFWGWLVTAGPIVAWRGIQAAVTWLYTFIVRLPWVVAVIVIGVIIIQGLTQHTTVIRPISVPETLAEKGYTSEVASQRLRDAILNFTSTIPSHKKAPEVALYGDLPNLVVPTVGISLDAVLSSIRTLSRSTRSRSISGEITIKHNLLWLVLRVDDKKIYESTTGVEIDKFDDLFVAAAPDVLKSVGPYLAALSLSYHDPDKA